MIKANFIQVSVTNRMVQLVSSDLHLTSLVWQFQTRERPCPRNLHQTHSVELTLSQKFAEILVASHLKRLSRLILGKFRRF